MHHSFGYTGNPDETFLELVRHDPPRPTTMRFIEKDNAEVEVEGAVMRLVNEAGAKMDLVLFMKPSWLEGAWVDAVKD